MIVTDTAQMIIPGPETGHAFSPGWVLHNDSPTTEIYLDVNINLAAATGSPNYVLEPGQVLTLSGQQTFWASTPRGTVADLHVVPSATFGGTTAAGGAAPAGGTP